MDSQIVGKTLYLFTGSEWGCNLWRGRCGVIPVQGRHQGGEEFGDAGLHAVR